MEVVSYRLRLRVVVPKYQPREERAPALAAQASELAIKGRRTIALAGTTAEATLYERDRVDVGATIEGPAIVEQFDATTLIPPGWRAAVDGFRNLVLTRAE